MSLRQAEMCPSIRVSEVRELELSVIGMVVIRQTVRRDHLAGESDIKSESPRVTPALDNRNDK